MKRDLAGAIDLRPLGLTRIAIGALLLLRTTPVLAPFDIAFLREATPLLGWPSPGFGFAWLPPGIVGALCVLRTLAAISFMLGVSSRISGLACGISGYLIASQSPFAQVFTLHLLYQAAMLLAVGDAGAALALRPSPARSPRSSYWLVRAFVASIYFWAGLFKCRPDWLDGRTLALLHATHATHGALADWLLATSASRAIAACSVALFELSAGPLLLWPRTRRGTLLLAYAFHLGLEATVYPDLLGWGMIALLTCFWGREPPLPSRARRAGSRGRG